MTVHPSPASEPAPSRAPSHVGGGADSEAAITRVDALLAELRGPDPNINEIGQRLLNMAEDPAVIAYLNDRRDDLEEMLDHITLTSMLLGDEPTGEASRREYHVRWLVRGHWRHVLGGRTFCTCCEPPQIASWVAPYIKGPAGAPWRGKQGRRQAA